MKRDDQVLYQTAAIRHLIIQGSGFTPNTKLTFTPRLTQDVDYTLKFESDSKLTLTLKKHRKWRYTGGALLLKNIDVGDGSVPVGSGGQGIQVCVCIALYRLTSQC